MDVSAEEARFAIIGRVIKDLWKHVLVDAPNGAKLIIPIHREDVEEKGSRGIADVGIVIAFGHLVDEPGIDGAKHKFAVIHLLLRSWNLFQDEADLRSAEVWVDS